MSNNDKNKKSIFLDIVLYWSKAKSENVFSFTDKYFKLISWFICTCFIYFLWAKTNLYLFLFSFLFSGFLLTVTILLLLEVLCKKIYSYFGKNESDANGFLLIFMSILMFLLFKFGKDFSVYLEKLSFIIKETK